MKLEKNQYFEQEEDIEILEPLTDEELAYYIQEHEDDEEHCPDYDDGYTIEQVLHIEMNS